MNNEPGTAPSDTQILGHLVASFAAVFLTMLVDFGVPLTDAQQRDLLSALVTGWAMFAGLYAWYSRTRRRPAPQPPAPTVRGQVTPPGGTVTDETSRLAQFPPRPTPTAPPNTWPPYAPGRHGR